MTVAKTPLNFIWGFKAKKGLVRTAILGADKRTIYGPVKRFMFGSLGPFVKMWTGSIWDRIAFWTQNNNFTGTNKFGSSTNYAQIDNAGKVTFVGSNTGLICGGMHLEDASIATTLTSAAVYYPISSGFSTGYCNNVTFQNSKELKITIAGVYKVDWAMSIKNNSSDQDIEGLVMAGASGTTAQEQTANITRTKENGVTYSIGGTGFITCAVGDLLRLALENEVSGGSIVTCNHANLTIIQVAG